MPTLRSGDAAVRIRIPVGDALTVNVPPGSSAYVVDPVDLSPATTLSASQTFGPYETTEAMQLTCTAGAVSYDVVSFDVVPVLQDPATGALTADGQPLVSGAWVSDLTPTGYYEFSLRASQPGFGSPADQSGQLNDPAINTTLFPPARQNSTTVALNAYRSPAVLNGKLYKCTTAGDTAAAEPGGLAGAAIGATVADGTAVWTVERGPWHTAASGFRHITSIAQGLLPASGAIACPVIPWDMANGDSLIVRIRCAWNGAATDSRTALPESSVLIGNAGQGASRGFMIAGTGTTYADFKLFVRDTAVQVNSGHVAAGFNRKPLDGNARDTCIMIDGPGKRAYCWTDGVSYAQSEMFDAANKTPHGLDLSTVTGSTLSTNPVMLGIRPGGAASYDFGVMALDVIVLPGRALPTNMQAVADWFYQRGADAHLPASLLMAG